MSKQKIIEVVDSVPVKKEAVKVANQITFSGNMLSKGFGKLDIHSVARIDSDDGSKFVTDPEPSAHLPDITKIINDTFSDGHGSMISGAQILGALSDIIIKLWDGYFDEKELPEEGA